MQDFLRQMVDKLDTQIRRNKDKLVVEQGSKLTLSKETQAQVDELARQIKDLQVMHIYIHVYIYTYICVYT